MLVSLVLGDPAFGLGCLLLLTVALLLEPLLGMPFGPFRWLPHPVRPVGWLIARLEAKLNRPNRRNTDRLIRGALTVIIVIGLAAAAGTAVTAVSRTVPWAWIAELTLVIALLAQRSLFVHVRRVRTALKADGVAGGRQAVAAIVGRDVSTLDDGGVSRAAIESCAENFSDGIVAPAFWYALAGLPGLLVYKAANTLDSMIGHRSPRYLAFGRAAARLDDALNLIPARFAALYLVLAAAFLPRAQPVAAFRTMLRDAGKHRSPNAGWPEAAMAGALGLALGGPRRYLNEVVDARWIGSGRARAGSSDIGRALWVYGVACLVHGLIVACTASILLAKS